MKRLLLVLAVLSFCAVTFAQVSPQYTVNLSFLTGGPYGQNSALDVSFGSQFTTNNTLQADFITMPAPSYTGYFGGDSYNLCGIAAIEKVLAATSLSCGKFAPLLEGQFGLGRLDPTGSSTIQGFAALGGLGVGYDASGKGNYGLLFKGGWGHFGPTIVATETAKALSGNGFYFYSGVQFGGGQSQAATDAKIARMKYASERKAAKHLQSACKHGDKVACDMQKARS